MSEVAGELAAELRARDDHEPHRLTGFGWVEVFMRGGLKARPVPEDYFELDRHPEGSSIALVRCQCAVAHCLHVGCYPNLCPCGRAFFYDGTVVWALNSPSQA